MTVRAAKSDQGVAVGVDAMALVGGRLCLDFVNTANYAEGAVCDEKLGEYDDLLTWSERVGLIDAAAATSLRRKARERPAPARKALEAALSLRAAMLRIFTETSSDWDADLARLDRAAACVRLRRLGPGSYALAPGEDLSGWLARAVGASAVELMVSGDLARVKACPGLRCGWLFLDQSPSGRRRWCSMASCGNRSKAGTHYARRRAGG